MQSELSRPIVGIENRTAQEVFDIMCDRFRAEFGNEEAPRYTTRRLHEEIRKAEERGRQHEREAALSAAEPAAWRYRHDNVVGWSYSDTKHPRSDLEQEALYAVPPAPSEAVKASPEALEQFTAYFVKNYPGPDTIIFNPKWHAPKIFRAAVSALSAQVQDVAEYERHADYLEVMADVIMDSEMAGKLEAKLTMEKAAKFIRSHLPAAPAKQEG